MDEDRMVNEGMGGGLIAEGTNARIGSTTADTMDQPESLNDADERHERG